MTGEELGTILGDVICELEDTAMTIEDSVSLLYEVDGKAIVAEEAQVEPGQPRMTIKEFNELLGDVLSELQCVSAEIDTAMEMLQSIDGSTIGSGTCNEV